MSRAAQQEQPLGEWTDCSNPPAMPRLRLAIAASIALPLLGLGWAFWPVLVDLAGNWRNDPDYSAGAFVLPAGCYVAWLYRHRLARCLVAPCWWGLLLLGAGLTLRAAGIVYLYESLERYGLVIALAGLVLLIAGRQVFYTLRWVLCFLLLLVPLPGQVHNLVSLRMQELATAGTVFFLELFGVSTTRQGNILSLNHQTEIGVVEACNGLRMLTAFIFVAALLAFVVQRPRWQRITILSSSIPIAVVCNLVRLLITALLFIQFDSQVAQTFFHDFAGLSMMPLAILLMWGELYLLQKLVITDQRPLNV